MDPVRVAIAGCGTIAMMKHLPALANNAAVVVALYDISKQAAMKARDVFGNSETTVYDDYAMMLTDARIEVVYVLTPNKYHGDMTIEALNAGKHVYCEKPMAVNAQQAQRMMEASQRTGKLLTVGYQYRHALEHIYLRKESLAGSFGEVYYAKARAIRRRRVPTWGSFFDRDIQGGGVLIDVGTHALDLVLYFMNNYEPAYCIGTTYNVFGDSKQPANEWGNWDDRSYDVEDAGFGFIVMKNGATIILESSWALNVADTCEAQVMLAGTKGGADTFDGLRVNGIRHNTQYILRPDVHKTGIQPFLSKRNECDRECEVFLKAIRRQGELCVTAEQALTVTKILDGIYTSAKTGKPYYFT